MGGAQPLAVTMGGGTALVAEVDSHRIDRRLATRYCDERIDDLDAAIDRALAARDAKEGVSIGVLANAVDLLARLVARGIVPDLLTDQTSAHDELNGYVPHGMPYEAALRLRTDDPAEYRRRSVASMGEHVRLMLELQRRGAVTFDYGNNIRAQAVKAGVADAFEIEGFVPKYIRPLFCLGQGAVPLGRALGRPGRHRRDRPRARRALPGEHGASPLARHGREAGRLPGAPGADLLARLRRAREGGPRLQRARADAGR